MQNVHMHSGSTKQFFQRGTSGFPSTCIISRCYKKMSGEGALICAECAHAHSMHIKAELESFAAADAAGKKEEEKIRPVLTSF